MARAKLIKRGPNKPVVKKGYVIRPLTHNPFRLALGGLVVASKGKGGGKQV